MTTGKGPSKEIWDEALWHSGIDPASIAEYNIADQLGDAEAAAIDFEPARLGRVTRTFTQILADMPSCDDEQDPFDVR